MLHSVFQSKNTAGQSSKALLSAGFAIIFVFFLISGYLAYVNIEVLQKDSAVVAKITEVNSRLNSILRSVQNAESGQRGYLLTADENYLEHYYTASSESQLDIARLHELIDSDYALGTLAVNIKAKLDELRETVQLRRGDDLEAALVIVNSDAGKLLMDAIRTDIDQLLSKNDLLYEQALAQKGKAYQTSLTVAFASTLCGLILTSVLALFFNRVFKSRSLNQYKQNAHIELSQALSGELTTQEIGQKVLEVLASYLNADCGTFYVRHRSAVQQSLGRVATFGISDVNSVSMTVEPGAGLAGQVVQDQQTRLMSEVPQGYLKFGSSLGEAQPSHIVMMPFISRKKTLAFIEIGFSAEPAPVVLELLKDISSTVAEAVQSAQYLERQRQLLEQTQIQSEELQTQSEELKTQSEELRVTNEGLEEQSQSLLESQARLEQQQEELTQTNQQLQEQADLLANQRDALQQAQYVSEAKAQEADLANRYKSDFLANMSHELRTPLNSLLILSKLLADNAGGNLTAEQIKHSQTIYASGNDLLELINDILDLSKIESGHVELHKENVSLSGLANDNYDLFQPQAAQKSIQFSVNCDASCPEMFYSDELRLNQVLKNLLSNAIKFTDQGRVELNITLIDGQLQFAVTDTGIGMSEEQAQQVFLAFHQADSTISRKYGGTGLGLSISRQLVELLGGSLQVNSTLGEGSVFTVTLPLDEPVAEPETKPELLPSELQPPAPSFTPLAQNFFSLPALVEQESAHSTIRFNNRLVLVAEDDQTFATILASLAQDLGFTVLQAKTAEQTLAMALAHLPAAILLDIGLPDGSGLNVLEQLKSNPRTRDILVHIISGDDHKTQAYALGATSYLIKPVADGDVARILNNVEQRSRQKVKHLLLVEDDETQVLRLRQLFNQEDVETTVATTASQCLDALQNHVFDCMVLDLSLPDSSGFEILETLSEGEVYSFPPVIVYTAKDLPAKEEQILRRYTESIIVKDVKSPDRLLDEVNLFLNQIEPSPAQGLVQAKPNADFNVLHGRRILLVEDDIRNIYSLVSVLEQQGMEIEIARNGIEAMESLARAEQESAKPFDVCLMDIMMPEMDGITATQEIRKSSQWQQLPIIMLTAKAMAHDRARCIEAGASDYLAKPINIEQLLSILRVWVAS